MVESENGSQNCSEIAEMVELVLSKTFLQGVLSSIFKIWKDIG